MNSTDRVAELKRQIAERKEATARLEQELHQLASQESINNGQAGGRKLSARSHSTAGYAMESHPMSNAAQNDRAPKRQKRAMSQQTAQQMSRYASNRSVTGPFRQTGASLQPLAAPNRPLPNVQQAQADRLRSQDHLVMPDVGVMPEDFLASLSPDNSFLASSAAEVSPLDLSNTLSVSKCPSMVSGWSAADGGDGVTPITRQNSYFGDNHLACVDMSRWASESQSSRGFDDSMLMSQGQQVKHPCMEHDFLCVGANHPTDMIRSYSSSMQSQSLLLSPPDSAVECTPMERSQSNESTSSSLSTRSTASAKRRHKEALDRVIKASQETVLAPKPHPVRDIKAKAVASVKKDGKVAVPKNTYQRRKPVKVFCNQCNEQPDGFRGDHELRRHCQSKHEGIVKKFICRDPATVGIHSDLKVVKPLADCKQCRAGKPYGAYYNAAAHLRRQHFKPRVSRPKGKSAEKRGGKGGGDWPPMQELKAWFEERLVPANTDETGDPEPDDNDPDAADNEMELELDTYDFDNQMASYSLGQLDTGGTVSMNAPVSSATMTFGLGQYADVSPVQGMMPGFMDNGSQFYGTPFSVTDTVTPSNLQDMGQLPLVDGAWSISL